MNRIRRHCCRDLMLIGGLWALSVSCVAQSLPDPTRPPAAVLVQQTDRPDAGVAAVLQSVMMSPTRKSAIINGQNIELGAHFGTARLIKINETEVVLLNGRERQTLKLFPGIEKKTNFHPAHNRSDERPQ